LGYAVVLQGGQVEHLAARAFGTTERITSVTSYRVDAAGLYDDSYLSNVRLYSKLNELYRDWMDYRLEKLKLEIDRMQRVVEEARSGGQGVPLDLLIKFTEHQVRYLKHTARQMPCPALCREMVDRFGGRAIFNIGSTWTRIRAHPRFEQLLPAAMETARAWALMSPYLVDWYATKGVIDRGGKLHSYQGSLTWDSSQDYTLGDELLRQGLKEMLLAWLERTGLLALA
jgi:hypothetical protein